MKRKGFLQTMAALPLALKSGVQPVARQPLPSEIPTPITGVIWIKAAKTRQQLPCWNEPGTAAFVEDTNEAYIYTGHRIGEGWKKLQGV